MNEAEYKAAEGLRRSDLWRLHDSPEKFKYSIESPDEELTPAFTFGQAAHKLLLEPFDFDKEFAVKPEIDRRTTEGKERWAKFQTEAEGKTIIDTDTYETIRGMVNKANADPMVRRLMTGRKEQPYFWTDPDTGVKCKVKADCITWLEGEEIPVIVDYKTTTDARTRKFIRDAAEYGYYLQAAMYTEGVMRCLKLTERPMFVFVCQEKKAPYSLNLITVTEDAILYGMDTFRELLGIYKTCSETNTWPGYMGGVGTPNELIVPGWLRPGKGEEQSE